VHKKLKSSFGLVLTADGSGGDYVPIASGPAPAAPSANAHDVTVSLINTCTTAGFSHPQW